MANLYNDLSQVYEAMYQSFINYQNEFDFYSGILKKNVCKSVLEIGCGTGNLAAHFEAKDFEYTGMDLSEEMLEMAVKKNPKSSFIKADMRNFYLPQTFDSSIITGRSISYLLTNKEVYDAFNCINKHLTTQGILCFDLIDANRFIPLINGGKKITHKAEVKNKKYQRDSFWEVNFSESWAFDWHSIFFEETENGGLIKIGEDKSTIRAFTKDEMILFLNISGFKVKEIIERSSYAFDTFVIVAEKN